MTAVFVLGAVGLAGLWRLLPAFILDSWPLGCWERLIWWALVWGRHLVHQSQWFVPSDLGPLVYYCGTPTEWIGGPLTTAIGAVVFSVVGAVFPAARAADVDPVEALRHD